MVELPRALPKPGEIVGGFVIERELARGGMGAVFVAHDPRTERRVALKVMLEARDPNSMRRRRFEREARVGARLDHPGIARVYAAGEDQGRCFLAVELIEGARSLDAFARERDLDPTERIQLVAQVCDALAVAHAAGTIHRDLKPDNLLVTPTGLVKIVDFGVAKDSQSARLTRSGEAVGTITYMAPEQVSGNSHSADARTDVFALGTILFELISGEHPFAGQTSIDQVRKIVEAQPPDLLRLAPNSPPGLVAVLQRALAKSPDDRYSSVADLAEDLRALLDAPGAPARGVGALVVGGILLVAVVGGAVAVGHSGEPPPDDAGLPPASHADRPDDSRGEPTPSSEDPVPPSMDGAIEERPAGEDVDALVERAQAVYGEAATGFTAAGAGQLEAFLPRFDEALATATRAIELRPDSEKLRRMRLEFSNYPGRITARRGVDPRPYTDLALADASWILDHCGPDARALNLRALAHQYVYEYELATSGEPGPPLDAAVNDYRAAVALDEQNMDAVTSLGHAYYKRAQLLQSKGQPAQADYALARDTMAVVVERGGEIYSRLNGDAHLVRGVCKLNLGDQNGGLNDLVEAVRLNPAHFSILPANLRAAVQARREALGQ